MDIYVEIYLRDGRPPGRRNKNGRRKLHGGTKAIMDDTPTYLRFEGRGLAGALADFQQWVANAEKSKDGEAIRRRFARTRIIGPGDPRYEEAKKSWQSSR